MLKILEYVKKFLIFIILFCILAMIAIYTFLSSKQTYTANVVIEYTNTDMHQMDQNLILQKLCPQN